MVNSFSKGFWGFGAAVFTPTMRIKWSAMTTGVDTILMGVLSDIVVAVVTGAAIVPRATGLTSQTPSNAQAASWVAVIAWGVTI